MLGVFIINSATKKNRFPENARLRLTRDTVYGKTHVQIYEVAEQYYIVSGAYEKYEKKKAITLD